MRNIVIFQMDSGQILDQMHQESYDAYIIYDKIKHEMSRGIIDWGEDISFNRRRLIGRQDER